MVSREIRSWQISCNEPSGGRGGDVCRYFKQDGVGVTDGGKIAEGFCDFYCQVGPKLAARLEREGRGLPGIHGGEGGGGAHLAAYYAR